MNILWSSNDRTMDFESMNLGLNPSQRANDSKMLVKIAEYERRGGSIIPVYDVCGICGRYVFRDTTVGICSLCSACKTQMLTCKFVIFFKEEVREEVYNIVNSLCKTCRNKYQCFCMI